MKILRVLTCLILAISMAAAPAMAVTKPHTVKLTWTASVTGTVNHYAVYRSTAAPGCPECRTYVYLGYTTGTSYINGKNPDGTPLVEGTTYYYVVVAYTATKGEFSLNSNEAAVTIPVTVVIAPATNLQAVNQ